MLVIGLTLGACTTTTASVAIDAFKRDVCSIWQPISWSTKDTDATIAGVKKNNRVRERFCKGV